MLQDLRSQILNLYWYRHWYPLYTFSRVLSIQHGYNVLEITQVPVGAGDTLIDSYTFAGFKVGIIPTPELMYQSPGYDQNTWIDAFHAFDNPEWTAFVELWELLVMFTKRAMVTSWTTGSASAEEVLENDLQADTIRQRLMMFTIETSDSLVRSLETFAENFIVPSPDGADTIQSIFSRATIAGFTPLPTVSLNADKVAEAVQEIAMSRVEISANNGSQMFSVVGGTRTD